MRENIKEKLSQIKNRYLNDGIEIIGIFGSVAKNKDDLLSDIDIAYKLNKDIFFKNYKDGFSQLIKLEDIKNELEKEFKQRVDFINLTSNEELKQSIKKDLIYV